MEEGPILLITGPEQAGFTVNIVSDPLDDLFAEQALRPENQEHQSHHIGEPFLNRAAQHRADINLRQLLAGANDDAADNSPAPR